MGVKLFMHAVRLLVDNLAVAIRISGVIYVVCILIPTLLLPGGEQAASSDQLPLQLLASIISLGGGIWIAVAWHRFILLDEIPAGFVPVFDGRRLLSYLGWSILLGLILVPIGIGVALIGGLLSASGGPGMVILVGAVSVFILTAMLYRFAAILPAVAVDQKMRLGEAWRATRGATGDILVLTLISTLCILVIDLPSLAFTGSFEIIGRTWQAVTSWVVLLVGASILTTLYGHYAQGRPIR